LLVAVEIFSFFIALLYSGIWVPEFFTATDSKLEPWAFISTASLTGLLTVYIAFLTFGNFQTVFYLCHVVGTVSACWIIYKTYVGGITRIRSPLQAWQLGILALAAVILFGILFTGIDAWSARSIWYFQAKILHHTGSLISPDWHNSYYHFTNANYPKLYPVVVAFLMSPWSAWNEYLPKWSLIVFFIPLISTLFSLRLKPATTFLLFLAFVGIPGSSMWDGNPDGYLAAFFALGVLSFAQFQKTSEKIYLLQTLLLLGVVINLKQEGLALIVCFTVAVTFFNPSGRMFFTDRNVTKFTLVPIAAYIFWSLRKMELNFSNYISANQSWFERMGERIMDVRPFIQVVKYTAIAHFDILIFAILLTAYFHLPHFKNSLTKPKWLRRENMWILITAGMYFAFLFIVYLGMPFDLQWYAESVLILSAASVKCTILVYVALAIDADPPPPPVVEIIDEAAEA
jgi:hypothetical protein